MMAALVLVAALAVLFFLIKARSDAKAHAAAEAARREREWVARCEAVEKQLDEQGLPTVEANLKMPKGEVCHWFGPATWMETRKVTKRVNYHGPTVSIPIVKGVRYRLGSIAPSVDSDDVLMPIDSGTLYVTSGRVLFDGQTKNVTIKHDKLLKVTLLVDGIILDKETGKDPVLKLGEEAAPLVAGILSRIG